MDYSTLLAHNLSTTALAAEVRQQLRNHLESLRESLEPEVVAFFAQACSPTAAFELEEKLDRISREFKRQLISSIYNRLEGDAPEALPSHVDFEGELYRIMKEKTPATVDTLFGPIKLWRHLYRPVTRDSAEASIVPLEQTLGVVENTTPALAEAANHYLAEAGANQRAVQDRLKTDHGVTMGTQRLRNLSDHFSGAMAAARQQFQVNRLLDLLKQADESSGKTR